MKITELTAAEKLKYNDFFIQGLARHSDCFKMSPQEIDPDFFPTDDAPESFTLAAIEDSGMLMGVLSFQLLTKNRLKLAHKGELFRMYVAIEFGGKRIGEQLITQLVERVKMQLPAIEQINLNVVSSNEKAKKLYEKLGFERFGTERNAIKFEGEYHDDDYMALHLKSD